MSIASLFRQGLTQLGFVAAVICAVPASAHHSYSAFDRSRMVTVQGVVVQWEWTNPHSVLVIEVADSAHQTHQWRFEGASPLMLSRRGGLNRNSLKPGDKITVTCFPARAEPYYGSLNGLLWPDGRSITMGPPSPGSGNHPQGGSVLLSPTASVPPVGTPK